MSMDAAAWNSLHRVMNTQNGPQRLTKETLKRIAGFAAPHKKLLIQFLRAERPHRGAWRSRRRCWPARVVDAIVDGRGDEGRRHRLPADRPHRGGRGRTRHHPTRWLSATIGEGLILDLRTAVFDHVQRMPVAFFTRTRTGALVSRLNNDVIGAQRAFSDTLSGVVSNVVALVLTLAVMLSLSWQITLLALVLLPVFVVPARRMGSRLAALQREAANHNAAMGTQMTERFSAPGATLVKLFGRPDEESAEFAARARRVRDIGVRTAMVQSVFVTALTLVSALALALVYGLGGFYALQGPLDAGAVVALALLLTRLYAPLTALASARVEVMSALVSFERVFEVLDLAAADRARSRCPSASRTGRSSVEFDARHVRLPVRRQGLARLARGGRDARQPRRRRGAARRVVPRRAGPDGRARRHVGRRQVDDRSAAPAPVRRRQRRGAARRRRRPRALVRSPCARRSAWSPRTGTCSTSRSARTCCSPVPRRPTTSCGTRCATPGSTTSWPSLPDGLDTVVGERGYRLSGGERQRLTIARLLLARPRVVILDEATAHLDSTSEAAVQAALGRGAGRAHGRRDRPPAVDRPGGRPILVVEDGRIVERGTHDELLAPAAAATRSCYRTQFDAGALDQPLPG